MLKLKEDVQKNTNILNYELDQKKIKDLSAFVPLLIKFKILKRLSLRSNQLQRLPATFVSLKTLEQLDLSDNNFKQIEDVVATLKGLPRLWQLSISVENKEDQELITRNLPTLRYLNGKVVDRERADKAKDVGSSLVTINKEYLVSLATISDALNTLVERDSPGVKEDFIKCMETAFQSLGQFMQTNIDNPLFLAVRVIQTRFQLQKFCFRNMVLLLSKINPEVKKMLEKLLQYQEHNVKTLIGALVIHMKQKIDEKIAMKSDAIDKVNERIQELRQQNHELTQKVRELQQDNKSYIKKLIEYAKGISESNMDQEKGNPFTKLLSYQSGIKLPEVKKMNQQQVQDLIVEIYDSKKKQQEIHNKGTTMCLYLPKFFNYKFGIPELSNFYYNLFKQNLMTMAQTQSYSILTFQNILNNECQESYRDEQKKVLQNLNNVIKRVMMDRGSNYDSGAGGGGLTSYDISRVMGSKTYDQNPKNNFRIQEDMLLNIIKMIYPDEAVNIINTINDQMGTDWRKSSQNSAQRQPSLQSPTKNSYRFRNPLPYSTPSPKKPNASAETRTITYKKFINIIMNLQLQNHVRKFQRITNLFKGFDQDNDGVIGKTTFLSLLARLQIEANSALNSTIQEYLQYPKITLKRENAFFQQVDDKEITINYTSYIEFSKKKLIKGKSLIQIEGRQNIDLL